MNDSWEAYSASEEEDNVKKVTNTNVDYSNNVKYKFNVNQYR